MLAWYRDLIHLRRRTPDLNDGEPGHTRVSFDEKAKWLRIDRGSIALICNLGESSYPVSLPEGSVTVLASRGAGTAELPPDSVAIFRTKSP